MSEKEEKELYQRIRERLEDPKWLFHGGIGTKITRLAKGFCEGEITLEEKHGNVVGIIHGGLLLTLSDNLGGAASATLGVPIVTASCQINFLNAPDPAAKKISGTASIISTDSNLYAAEIRLFDDHGKLLAAGLNEYIPISR